jgi:hypothetical protein
VKDGPVIAAPDGRSVLHMPLLELSARPVPGVAGPGPHRVRLVSVAFELTDRQPRLR